MKKILEALGFIFYKLSLYIQTLILIYQRSLMGHIGKRVVIDRINLPVNLNKVILGEDVIIQEGANFIISGTGEGGRVVVNRKAAIGNNFTVVNGAHNRELGVFILDSMRKRSADRNKDIVINEDAWVGANVSILAGVTIGRGSNVGTGSVVRNNVPPYAIVAGNPAKIIGFSFTPEEIIKHEEILYKREDRIELRVLEKNYKKYYIDRLDEIADFLKK